MGKEMEEVGKRNTVELFFLSTLILWFASVSFQILLTNRTQLVYIIAGSFFYQSSNSLIRFFSTDPLFVNTSVSLIHSMVTSTSVIFILYREWLSNGSSGMFDHSQLVEGTWPWAFEALCFSCGYFAYDQWDMLHYRLYNGWIPSILVHHLVLLICFTLALYRNVTINYLILTLICELHSIFLHVRKVRRMAGIRNARSIVVKLEWFLNWITFFVARCASHILITAKLIRDAHKFDKGVELPLALFGMAGMNFLNIGLGIDLFKAFKRERKPQQVNHHQHHE
ncbi:TLC domain-containing protein 2-like [Trifolium pratense]|uniref:TLC domain-containing protein 2-like n=1 Tax=Trifolium pratense TaxID=57577 RepID=A0A2K3KYV8_TRIPR|nr:TLC domain-containing protein 2-like isoform X1 [Trifolium pratense]PNX71470.1 TLC domain-containing protein 2-like [Trifolium pratense]